MKQIRISGKVYHLSAPTFHVLGGDSQHQEDPDVIDTKMNTNNPFALAAKTIAQTGTAIVAFDRHRVPNIVRYGPVLMQCSLYRKEIDVRNACGLLSHRADVCPTPSATIYRRCGAARPR
ncbi:hypothetical protein MTO96_044824 [Rhipicephalus appendiculatus]